MRLMFMIPRLSGGGAEKVIANLASGLAKRHKVYLAYMEDPSGFAYPVSPRVKLIKLRNEPKYKEQIEALWKTLELDRHARLKKAKRTWYQEYPVEFLQRLKKRLRIDCAISFLTPANSLNTEAASRCPAIISIRSCMQGEYAPAEARHPVKKTAVSRSCKQADRIVSVSKEAVQGLVEEFDAEAEKVSVIYNPCDARQIRRRGRETPDDEALMMQMEAAEFVFVSSGRITPKKGQWHLLHAFRLVLNRHPEARLVLFGKTDDARIEDLLKETIKDLQMEGQVILAGFHENPFPYLAKGGAFVLTSFNEGFPNAVPEAMALGLPVISTDCSSGPREILAPGTDCTKKTKKLDLAEYGILTPECSGDQEIHRPPEENEVLLAEAMLRLLEDPDTRRHYSKKSLERSEQFPEEEFLRQWEKLILDTAAEKKHTREP